MITHVTGLVKSEDADATIRAMPPKKKPKAVVAAPAVNPDVTWVHDIKEEKYESLKALPDVGMNNAHLLSLNAVASYPPRKDKPAKPRSAESIRKDEERRLKDPPIWGASPSKVMGHGHGHWQIH